jgi:ABC-2 type transport system ATP-binding protein
VGGAFDDGGFMTRTDSPILEVQGLTKRYGETTVVDDVDLAVHRGEIFGVLGANGAGKTTAIECIQGLRRPDRGHIRLCGLDPHRDRHALSGLVGSQLQESELPDRLRVEEALRLFATERSDPIEQVMDRWELTPHRRTAFANLSGGQKQRLFIALALLNRPELVFLDELTQGLDLAARRMVWELISSLRDQGTTVVLVTHYTDEAEALCDRLAIMRNGTLVSAGTPSQLVKHHSHPIQLSFTPLAGHDVAGLRSVRGVESLVVVDGRVELRGERELIAHVGAALVASDAVPADLTAAETCLEDVLIPLIKEHA